MVWVQDNFFWILPVLLWVLYVCWAIPRDLLEWRVRSLMLHSHEKENARELRTILLLLDGHRMSKKLREALVVWLAEREGDS